MGIKVRIPGPLRKLTNELDQVELTAGNIGELIDLLEKEYNGMVLSGINSLLKRTDYISDGV